MPIIGCGNLIDCPPINGTPGPPGPKGRPGTPGIEGPPGIDGLNAFGITMADFTIPPVGVAIKVQVNPAQWATPNQIIYVMKAGYFQVADVSTLSVMTLTNLGYPDNLLPGTIIGAGRQVSPAGAQGAAGPVGPKGSPGVSAYTFSTNGFTVPPPGGFITVQVVDSSWAIEGEWVWVEGANRGNSAGLLQITGIYGNSITLCNTPLNFETVAV